MKTMTQEGIETGAQMLEELRTNKDTLAQWREDPLRVLNRFGFEVDLEAETAPDLRKHLATLPVAEVSGSRCTWCKIGIGAVLIGGGAALVAAIAAAIAVAVAAAIASGGTVVPEEIAGAAAAAAGGDAAATGATALLCGVSVVVLKQCISAAAIFAAGAGVGTIAEIFLSALTEEICKAKGDCAA